jgi:hypothetical protein
MPDEVKKSDNPIPDNAPASLTQPASPVQTGAGASGTTSPIQTQPDDNAPKNAAGRTIIPVPSSRTPVPPANKQDANDTALTVGSKDKLDTQTASVVDTAKGSDEPLYVPNHLTTKENANDLVKVFENVGGVAGKVWRGVCRKCGWQTHQPTKTNAAEAVADHVQRHVAPGPGVGAEIVKPQVEQLQAESDKPAA